MRVSDRMGTGARIPTAREGDRWLWVALLDTKREGGVLPHKVRVGHGNLDMQLAVLGIRHIEHTHAAPASMMRGGQTIDVYYSS